MTTPPNAPPLYPQSPPKTSKGRFWTGFGVGCAVSLVGALLIGVIAMIIAMVAGLSTGLSTARDQARTAFEARQAQQIAAGQAIAAEAAAAAKTGKAGSDMRATPAAPDAAADGDDESMSIEELAITTALENEDYDTAEKLAREYVEHNPEDEAARALLQTVRIERAVAAGDITSADALFSEAREMAMEIDPSAALAVADLWISEGEPDRGLAIAEAVLKATTGNDEYDRYVRGSALLIRGLAKAELGDPVGGASDIEDAIELAPDEETAAEWQQYLDEIREKSR
ncbi:MAG: hypothetical protein DWH86_01110 [Planctomycetota bacterium]|nr:MAG: hypothetical protein DWH86_01110 [Planctomycetota bacterium]